MMIECHFVVTVVHRKGDDLDSSLCSYNSGSVSIMYVV